MKTIYYVTGGCGSGKTEAAITYMQEACAENGTNILLVQPTKLLLEETKRRIEDRFLHQRVVLIHGDNASDEQSVHARIKEFTGKLHKGVILGITHTAFFGMSDWKRLGKWELIVDEVPTVDGSFQLNVPNTADWFLSDFEIESDRGLFLRLCRAARHRHFRDVAENKEKDELLTVLQELYEKVGSPLYEVWVPRSRWTRLTAPKLNGAVQRGALICHWVLQPKIFDSWDKVTVMGANFTSSMLYLLWQKQVAFLPHPAIKAQFEQYPDAVSKRLTIHFLSERNNSMRLQNGLGATFDTIAKNRIRELWGEEPYLLILNNAKKDAFEVKDDSQIIPTICHGRNEWSGYTRIAFLAALNDTPPHYTFLREVAGLQPEAVRQAKSQEAIHQAIMRTALRQPNALASVEALVVDKETAYQLKDRMFPAARIAKPEAIPQGLVEMNKEARERVRTKSALTPVERNRKARETKSLLLEDQKRLTELLAFGHKTVWSANSPTQVRCYDSSLIYKPEIVTSGVGASFVGSKFSRHALPEFLTNWDEVLDLMRQAFDRQYKAKDDNLLMSGAYFDQQLSPDTSRGLANVQYVSFMQLDFDCGDLAPSDLGLIFDDFSWFAYNSFNNDASGGQLRYRVFIPFQHPVTADFYHALWDLLAARIESDGFTVGKKVKGKRYSGLDKSKRPANSIFYMPCQARTDYRHNSFFDTRHWDETLILDPMDPSWTKAMPVDQDDPRTVIEFPKSADLTKLQRAVYAERNRRDEADLADLLDDAMTACRTAEPGTGNPVLFRQAAKLQRYGLNDFELEQQLQVLASQMRHPEERREQIPSILHSLRGNGRMPQAA